MYGGEDRFLQNEMRKQSWNIYVKEKALWKEWKEQMKKYSVA